MTPLLSRRLVFPALLVAAAFSARAAPVAWAAPADDEWRAPEYSVSDMAVERETLPSGWTLAPEGKEPRPEAEKAISDVIDALREEHKIARTDVTSAFRTVTMPEGESATLVLLDLWQDPAKFPAALEAKAKEKGWGFREMASPSRMLVVAAPEAVRSKVTAMQLSLAARNLAQLAWQRLETHNEDMAGPLAKASIALEPGIAFAHVTLGVLAEPVQRPSDPKPEPSAWDAAMAEYRAAFGEKATIPLTVPNRYAALTVLGEALVRQGGEHNAEARDRLKEAIELAPKVANTQPWATRYDLACVHGRLKELDPAFAQLNLVLEQDARVRVNGIQHWRTDTDFDNLHADPRWAEILAKYPAGGKPPEAPPEAPREMPPEPPSGVPPPGSPPPGSPPSDKPPEQPPVK